MKVGCRLSAVSHQLSAVGRDVIYRVLFISWNHLFLAERVRDWSGILCERERERDSGNGIGIWGRERVLIPSLLPDLVPSLASKDIAESPTALPERPDKV